MSKRLFDVAVAACGLLLLSPVLALIALAIRLDSPGPALFRQERIGRRFKPFTIYKFRTMHVEADGRGPRITAGEDRRITRVGRLLRRTKLDELPQLWNVLKGDMSLVGPRPELRHYVELFSDAYAEILEARPGITDFASIKYRDEAALLSGALDPEQEYISRILPDKILLAREYVRRSSLRLDVQLMLQTVRRVGGGSGMTT